MTFMGFVKEKVSQLKQNMIENQARERELKAIENEAYHEEMKLQQVKLAKAKAKVTTDIKLKSFKERKTSGGSGNAIIDNIANQGSSFEGGFLPERPKNQKSRKEDYIF